MEEIKNIQNLEEKKETSATLQKEDILSLARELKELKESIKDKEKKELSPKEIKETALRSLDRKQEEKGSESEEYIDKISYLKQERSKRIAEASELRKNYIQHKTEEFLEQEILNPKMFNVLKLAGEDFSKMPEEAVYFHHDLVLCAAVKIMEKKGMNMDEFYKMRFGKLKEDISLGKFSIDKIKKLTKREEK